MGKSSVHSYRWLEDRQYQRGGVLDADLGHLRQRHAALLGIRTSVDAKSFNESWTPMVR